MGNSFLIYRITFGPHRIHPQYTGYNIIHTQKLFYISKKNSPSPKTQLTIKQSSSTLKLELPQNTPTNTPWIHRIRIQYILKSYFNCQKWIPRPKKPHLTHKAELDWIKIGITTEYTLNTPQIQPIRIQYTIKSYFNCQKWNPHPRKPHLTHITELDRSKIEDFSSGQ